MKKVTKSYAFEMDNQGSWNKYVNTRNLNLFQTGNKLQSLVPLKYSKKLPAYA